jgi:hypothetical protein
MIRKLIRIVAGSQSRRHGPEAVRGRQKLRPRMMELEGRELLSTFAGNGTVHHGDLDMLRPAAGTAALNHVVDRAHSGRAQGGLSSDGSTTRRDVAIRNNTVHLDSRASGSRDVTDARRLHSRRPATTTIVNDTFNVTVTGGVPTNWTQFAGNPGDVVETAKHHLTITDTASNSAGIISNTVPFPAVGVTTKITAVISSVSVTPKVGNAIVGIVGPNGTQLAGGIDSQGNVFIIEYDPAHDQQQNIVKAGLDSGYKGGTVTMTLIINSTGVQITAGSVNRTFTFKELNNFSMNTAFSKGAIPALVAASQPKESGAAASFQSINVVTTSGNVKLTGGRAGRGRKAARG